MITEKWTEAQTIAVMNHVRPETQENALAYYENFFVHGFQNDRRNRDEMERILSYLEIAIRCGEERADAVLGKAILRTFTRRQVVEDALSFLTRAMRRNVHGAAAELCNWYFAWLQLDDLRAYMEDADVGLSDCYVATEGHPRVLLPSGKEEIVERIFSCAECAVRAGSLCGVLPAVLFTIRQRQAGWVPGVDRLCDALLEIPESALDDSAAQLAAMVLDRRMEKPIAVKAVRLLERAAGTGSVAALTEWGGLLLHGTPDGLVRDVPRALECLGRACEMGGSKAMYLLSVCYETGEGVDVDEERARALLERAAAADLPEALVRLGRRLVETASGDDQAKSIRRGCDMIRRAAEERDSTPAWETMLEYHRRKIGPFRTNKFARAARAALQNR